MIGSTLLQTVLILNNLMLSTNYQIAIYMFSVLDVESFRFFMNVLVCRFSNVIKGRMHNGFTVKVTTQFLSPKVTYTVSLIFKHNGEDQATHIPFKFKLEEERYHSNSCTTQVRDDGWLIIEVHQFTSFKKEHDLAIQFSPLFNITSSRLKHRVFF